MNLKFRAYDKDGQKMFSEDELIIWNNNVYANDSEKLSRDYLKGWSIDGQYLMQSTGLTDKNGKEIFEGDVVTDGQTVGDIKHHQTYGFYMIDDKGIERFFSDGNCIEDFEEDAETISEILEIIGNIYENPELLEERL